MVKVPAVMPTPAATPWSIVFKTAVLVATEKPCVVCTYGGFLIFAIVRVVEPVIPEPKFTVIVLALLSTERVAPVFPVILLAPTALKS